MTMNRNSVKSSVTVDCRAMKIISWRTVTAGRNAWVSSFIFFIVKYGTPTSPLSNARNEPPMSVRLGVLAVSALTVRVLLPEWPQLTETNKTARRSTMELVQPHFPLPESPVVVLRSPNSTCNKNNAPFAYSLYSNFPPNVSAFPDSKNE